MKKILILICALSLGCAGFGYSGMYGNRYSGYSTRSYGSASTGYSSAASTSSRYNASHSRYNYGNASSSSYSSQSGTNYTNTPSRINKSYYGNTSASYSGRSSYPPASYKNTDTAASIKAVPFRYNTLDYTRVRKMEADPPKEFSARCSDIGDASFCR